MMILKFYFMHLNEVSSSSFEYHIDASLRVNLKTIYAIVTLLKKKYHTHIRGDVFMIFVFLLSHIMNVATKNYRLDVAVWCKGIAQRSFMFNEKYLKYDSPSDKECDTGEAHKTFNEL